MPNSLSNALFLIALLVPIAMHLTGMIILMVSIVWKHFAAAREHTHSMEALAH